MIKVKGKKARKVLHTGPKQPLVDASMIAEALGAERIVTPRLKHRHPFAFFGVQRKNKFQIERIGLLWKMCAHAVEMVEIARARASDIKEKVRKVIALLTPPTG